MIATMPRVRSARALLQLVEPFGPAVEGGELVFATEPGPGLLAPLSVLHTGVRAALVRRQWWGSTVADGTRPRVVTLDPAAPVPVGIGLLAVEGDRCWDRIDPAARLDHPDLFDPDEC